MLFIQALARIKRQAVGLMIVAVMHTGPLLAQATRRQQLPLEIPLGMLQCRVPLRIKAADLDPQDSISAQRSTDLCKVAGIRRIASIRHDVRPA